MSSIERAVFDQSLQALKENHGQDAAGGYVGVEYDGFRDARIDVIVQWTAEPPTITRVKLFRNSNTAAHIVRFALDKRGDVTAGTAFTRNDPDIFDQALSEQFRRATEGCEPYQEVLAGLQLRDFVEDLDILVSQGN